MRWRVAGLNWEPRRFEVSAGLIVLLAEVENWDAVKRTLDGTVASEAHDEANPNSDHRPMPTTGPGIVRAADIGEANDAQGDHLAECLRSSRDKRIAYVIHDGRRFMGSEYPKLQGRTPWEWIPYTGPNAHLKHNHISVTAAADNQTSPWNLNLEGDDDMPTEEEIAAAVWAAAPGGDAFGNAWQTLIRTKANTDLLRAEGVSDTDLDAALDVLVADLRAKLPADTLALLKAKL